MKRCIHCGKIIWFWQKSVENISNIHVHVKCDDKVSKITLSKLQLNALELREKLRMDEIFSKLRNLAYNRIIEHEQIQQEIEELISNSRKLK